MNCQDEMKKKVLEYVDSHQRQTKWYPNNIEYDGKEALDRTQAAQFFKELWEKKMIPIHNSG